MQRITNETIGYMTKRQNLLQEMARIFLGASMMMATVTATAADLKTSVWKIGASVQSTSNPVSLIIDGNATTNAPYWSTLHGEEYYGQYEYVELQWESNCSITGLTIFWAKPDGDVDYPEDAYLSSWNGDEWVKNPTAVTVNSRGSSLLSKLGLTTNRIRIYMKGKKGVGIREVSINGTVLTGCSAAVLSADSPTIPFYIGKPITLMPRLTLPEGESETPRWTWELPDGSVSHEPTVVANQTGQYVVTYERECGRVTSLTYTLYDPSSSYAWPNYSPTLNYDYRSEYPSLEPPTKFLPENNNQQGYMADGWWAIAWGPKTSKYVTEIAKKNILKKMNEDFAYFRDEMGWPPDKRARNGYYSTVYVFGSGLYSDTADSTARGGWQGATWYNGSSWPMVNISYYPIACFDPNFTYDKYYSSSVTDQTFQQNACVHEGIHAIFADLEGCKQSAWYQEAGNTWLQAEAEVRKTGKTPESMGYLSAGNMIAPFMPIECYSGWLLDDSFGGPSAEGVNMYNGSQQICTWRNMLGGVQYGELFPHFVSEILGKGSIPWIWRHCKTRVLEGMADSLGDSQMRRLIMEYRARQAMIDVGSWSQACRKLLNDNWLLSVKQEWEPYWKIVEEWKATPYSNMYKCNEVDSAGWYYPEYRTTPGWSGANQVPLHVEGVKGNTISIHFKPLGKNMTCQLCYRSKRSKIYYSQPIQGEGDVAMTLQEAPANNVVIAVITNTDYIYENDETRKRHFDYRLKMGENVYQPAKAQIKWYMHTQTLKDPDFKKPTTGIEEVEVAEEASTKFTLCLGKTIVRAGEDIPVNLKAAGQYQVPVVMYSAAGTPIYSQSFMRDGDYHIPTHVTPGLYILRASNGHESSSVKIVVK